MGFLHRQNDFTEVSKNLDRYRFKNNFVGSHQRIHVEK